MTSLNATMEKLSSCERGVALKALSIYCMILYRKSMLGPGLNHQLAKVH